MEVVVKELRGTKQKLRSTMPRKPYWIKPDPKFHRIDILCHQAPKRMAGKTVGLFCQYEPHSFFQVVSLNLPTSISQQTARPVCIWSHQCKQMIVLGEPLWLIKPLKTPTMLLIHALSLQFNMIEMAIRFLEVQEREMWTFLHMEFEGNQRFSPHSSQYQRCSSLHRSTSRWHHSGLYSVDHSMILKSFRSELPGVALGDIYLNLKSIKNIKVNKNLQLLYGKQACNRTILKDQMLGWSGQQATLVAE